MYYRNTVLQSVILEYSIAVLLPVLQEYCINVWNTAILYWCITVRSSLAVSGGLGGVTMEVISDPGQYSNTVIHIILENIVIQQYM